MAGNMRDSHGPDHLPPAPSKVGQVLFTKPGLAPEDSAHPGQVVVFPHGNLQVELRSGQAQHQTHH